MCSPKSDCFAALAFRSSEAFHIIAHGRNVKGTIVNSHILFSVLVSLASLSFVASTNADLREEVDNIFAPSPAPPSSWKGVFYDNNFGSKNDPEHIPVFAESFKDMPIDQFDSMDLFEESSVSFGGELRFRYMDERNRLRGPAGRSTYDLWRWRHYLDYKSGDRFRVYSEMIDASIFENELPATAIDLNRWNIQQAFVDVKIFELDNRPVNFRAGRQELLYGSQHLISPLDWGNTRRNFEGFKLFSRGDQWDLDAFATRPVNTATGRPLARFDNERDKADSTRWFSGVYAVYKGLPQQVVDLYWLYLYTDPGFDNPARGDGDRHTIGTRWQGTRAAAGSSGPLAQSWKAEVEGAYQFGQDNGLDVSAGFFTSTLSVTLPNVAWSPQLTALYYWGSGDHDASDGKNQTFDTLFPLAHAYWGFIDNLGGQNLNDLSIQAAVKPTKQLSFLAAMHWFDLDTNNDFLYTAPGGQAGAIGSGTEIGEELDLVVNYSFNPNLSLQAGYFWFWYGSYVNNSLPRPDAEQFYLQSNFRY